jgi:hypothetical protein
LQDFFWYQCSATIRIGWEMLCLPYAVFWGENTQTNIESTVFNIPGEAGAVL